MSLQKLQKKALRELKASPQKAAMLALLAVVAAWFWAPLLFKSRSAAPGGQTTVAAAAPTTVHAPNLAPAVIPSAPAKKQASWRDVAATIDRDPLMAPATLAGIAEERNPFAPPVNIAASNQAALKSDNGKTPDEAETEKPPASPDDLGLVLSTTMVGRSRRAALISGRTYELGSKIRVEGEAFRLIEVEPNRIVLERDGEQFTLSIKRRKGGGRIELRPATP